MYTERDRARENEYEEQQLCSDGASQTESSKSIQWIRLHKKTRWTSLDANAFISLKPQHFCATSLSASAQSFIPEFIARTIAVIYLFIVVMFFFFSFLTIFFFQTLFNLLTWPWIKVFLFLGINKYGMMVYITNSLNVFALKHRKFVQYVSISKFFSAWTIFPFCVLCVSYPSISLDIFLVEILLDFIYATNQRRWK